MRLADGEARLRFGAARVARLATVGPAGAPHVVPITFALHGGQPRAGQMPGNQAPGEQVPGGQVPGGQVHSGQVHSGQMPRDQAPGGQLPGDQAPWDYVYSAVDAKPKSSRDLQRLRNIQAEPRVAVLADHYDEDWDLLWWVRAEGRATILSGPGEMAGPLRLLAGRYQAYRRHPPAGPVIAIAVHRWSGWAAR